MGALYPDPNAAGEPNFVTPSGVEPYEPKPQTFGQKASDAFLLNNDVVNLYRRMNEQQYPVDPSHNPKEMLAGTHYWDNYSDSFISSRSEPETRSIMRRIDEEEAAKQRSAESGPMGTALDLAAGVASPTVFLPAGQILRSARGGYSAIKSAASVGAGGLLQTAAQEAILQGTQETRTLNESLINIGSGTLLAGILGAGGSKLLQHFETRQAEAAVARARLQVDAHNGVDLLNTPPTEGFDVFHGSPHDFQSFDLSKIGTGEGAQSYGHGLYFAEIKGVAESYRHQLAGVGVQIDTRPGSPTHGLMIASEPGGATYKVRVHADREHMLDWDLTLSGQTSDIQAKLESVGISAKGDIPGFTHSAQMGSDILDHLKRTLGSDEAASRALRNSGIPGIKYLDQGSRVDKPIENATIQYDPVDKKYRIRDGDGAIAGETDTLEDAKGVVSGKGTVNKTSNFVIFDDKLLTIIEKTGEKINVRPFTPAERAAQERIAAGGDASWLHDAAPGSGPEGFHWSPSKFDEFSEAPKAWMGEEGDVGFMGNGVYLSETADNAGLYRKVAQEEGKVEGGGYLYKAKVLAKPETIADLEKPFNEQSPFVQKQLAPLLEGGITFEAFGQKFTPETTPLKDLVDSYVDKNFAEEAVRGRHLIVPYMKDRGITGIRHTANVETGGTRLGDRTQVVETKNDLIIFDRKNVKLTHRDGESIGRAASAPAPGGVDLPGVETRVNGEWVSGKPTEHGNYRLPTKDSDGQVIGSTEFIHYPGTTNVAINHQYLDAGERGKGLGLASVQRIVDWAHSKGWNVESSLDLSKDAKGIYDALKRRGYEVIPPQMERRVSRDVEAKEFDVPVKGYVLPAPPNAPAASPGGGMGSVGAASLDNRQLEMLSSIPGTSRLSPTRTLLNSSSIETRKIAADLASTPYRMAENVPTDTSPAVATTQGPPVDIQLRMAIDGTEHEIGQAMKQHYADYRFGDATKRAPVLRDRYERMTAGTDKLSYDDFKKEVGKAWMNMGTHDIPQASAAAMAIMEKVEHWAQRADQSVEGFKRAVQATGESYFPHLWNKELVKGQKPEFTNWLTGIYKTDQETKRAAQERIGSYHGALESHQGNIDKLTAKIAKLSEDVEVVEARAEETTRINKFANQRATQLREADQPERVKTAAYKIGDRVFEAPIHAIAMEDAMAALGAKRTRDLIDMHPGADLSERLKAHNEADGFVTTKGRFVGRMEAQEIAAKFEQLKEGKKGDRLGGLNAEDISDEAQKVFDQHFGTGKNIEKARGGAVFETKVRNRGNELADRVSGKLAAIDDLEQKLAKEIANHDEMRAKIEAELATWEGTSSSEAKSAMKARQKAEDDRIAKAAAKGEAPPTKRLTSADDAIDRAVKRILESDRNRTDAELRSRAAETTDRILGSPDGRLPYDEHMGGPQIGKTQAVANRGALAHRRLEVTNAQAAPWIEQDAEHVLASYMRTVVPDVLLSEKFGDPEMTVAFKQINEDYNKLIDPTKPGKARDALVKERDLMIKNMAAIRDRLRGVYGWSENTSSMARIANSVKFLNNISDLGTSAIASLSDFAGPLFRWGITAAIRDGWAPFFQALSTKGEEGKQFVNQMRAIGIGIDVATNARQHSMDEITGAYRPGSPIERTLQTVNDKFFIANLLAPLTDMQKMIASHAAVHEIVNISRRISEGKATAREAGNMAEAGIDGLMAERIWREFSKTGNGDIVGKVYLPNTASWTDRAAAEAFNGAVYREVNIAVVSPGQEKPLFLSRPVGSLLGQFKTFTAAATERILIANLQRRDAQSLSGVVAAIGLGMLSYKINSLTGGQPTSDDPRVWFREGFSRSGVGGWFEEGNAALAKATGGKIDAYRLTGADKPLSRYAGRSTLDMVLGPTIGKARDLLSAPGPAFRGDWSAADTHQLRRIMPFENMFYLRGLFNKVEETTNSHFNIPERREQTVH